MKFWFNQQKTNLEFISSKIEENEKNEEDEIKNNFDRNEFETSFFTTVKVIFIAKLSLIS